MAHNIEELVRAAAGMRATGMGWAAVGAALNRKESTVKKWPRLFGHHWKKYYEYSTRVVREETGTEAIAVLRCNLRSKSENTQVKAAGLVLKHLNHRPMLVQFREPQGDRDHEIWDADDAAEERNILKWVNEHIEDAQREKKIPEGMDIDNLRREWVKKIRYDGGAAAAILFMLAGFLLAQIRLPRDSVETARLPVAMPNVTPATTNADFAPVRDTNRLRPARRADRVCRDTPKGHAMKKPLLVAAALLAATTDNRAADTSARPNVIVIMADDFGYECVGANGGSSYKTPTLDKLAETGARFTHQHVQPLCTPTRVQLMTGIYNVRNYINFGYMDPKATTFGNLFKDAGYATCMVGKWQLGQDPEKPKSYGFDEHCLWQHTRRPPRYANAGLEINGKEVNYTNGEYGPDVVNDYALDFIGKKRDKPFFLYYSSILTHDPYQPTPDSPDYDPKAKTEKQNIDKKHFGEMVEYLDKLTGKLVRKLDDLKLRDNTLIVFLGDNGTGKGATSVLDGKPYPGGKGLTTRAGMHVPLIVNWPGKVPAGKVCGDLVDSTDILPTICDAAGIKPPAKIDGRTFWPQAQGEKGAPRDWFYCWFSRDGLDTEIKEFAANQRYKLYRDGQFFDYESDPLEKKPLGKPSDGETMKEFAKLQGVLDDFKDARPKGIVRKKKGAKD